MYILAHFNNKQYFIAECINSDMLKQLADVYNNNFSGVSFIVMRDHFINKPGFTGYKQQQEFIKDYKASKHLTRHLEHLPLDKA
mgnify:CR=1 FL=1